MLLILPALLSSTRVDSDVPCKDCAVQRQKAVTAYFSSEQLLPFDFADERRIDCSGSHTVTPEAVSAIHTFTQHYSASGESWTPPGFVRS